MRAWAYLLGGLIAWTVHFFASYVVASLFLTSTTARVLTALVTVLCLGASMLLAAAAWRKCRNESEIVRGWMDWTAFLAAAIASVAILWQGLPAILI